MPSGAHRTYYWDLGWLTCSGGYDKSHCGAAFSEAKQRIFCPVERPVRWPPTLQVPNPPFRPKSGSLDAAIVDDMSGNETWSADGEGEGGGFYGDFYGRRPAPFLFTDAGGAAARALSRRLADTLFFDALSAAVLDALAAELASARTGGGNWNVDVLNTPVVRYVTNASGPIGSLSRVPEALALIPLPLPLGTSQQQQRGGMQVDDAWGSKPLMLLKHDCSSMNDTERDTARDVAQLLRAGSMACVAAPGVRMDSADDVNAALFAGYGQRGTANTIAAFPFAIDFGATNATLGAGGGARVGATMYYNGTLTRPDGSPFNTFFRVSGALNRLANAFVAEALQPGAAVPAPRASMRYIRDMPTQGLVLRVDVGTFLGCVGTHTHFFSLPSLADSHASRSQAALLHVALPDAAARHRRPSRI
jgi:hypothetical protein